MKKILSAVLFLIFTFLPIIRSTAQIRIVTIGDSTMSEYDEKKYSGGNEMRGWAQLLPAFLNHDVQLDNWGKAGRSSMSFYYEFWGKLRETIQPGDYLIIQFGHNDEKAAGFDSDSLGTAAWGKYQDYLTKYIDESRSRGAIPMLMTSVVRAGMDENGKLLPQSLHNLSEICGNDSAMNYPLAMRDLAQKLNVPLIDMTTATQELVEKEYGYEKAKKLIYCNKDDTHLQATGALIFAKLVVNELIKQNILIDYLIDF